MFIGRQSGAAILLASAKDAAAKLPRRQYRHLDGILGRAMQTTTVVS
jgi:hypothetical protein